MTNFQKLSQKVEWRVRSILDSQTRDFGELSYRINRLPMRTLPGATFRFPWGKVEYVSSSDLRGQFSEIFVDRHYAFRSSVTEPVVIDAGGNIGLSAIWFRQEYPMSKLTVYEADPTLASLLGRNLAAAGISDVNVQNAAVWTHDGFVAFDNVGQDKGAVSATGTLQVRSIDLARQLPERVDLLKLDVEGAEYAIIDKLYSTGAIKSVQNLVAEFHVRRDSIDSVITALSQLRDSGMQVTMSSALGPWLGAAGAVSPFEIVGTDQSLMEVYAWR